MTDEFRKWVLLSVLTLAGCTQQRVGAPDLPKSISPGWRLAGLTHSSDNWRATYTGPGTAHVRIWPTHGEPEGLDRVQKWKPRADTVVFYSDRYFAVVDWSGVDRTQAGVLVRALERALSVSRDN